MNLLREMAPTHRPTAWVCLLGGLFACFTGSSGAPTFAALCLFIAAMGALGLHPSPSLPNHPNTPKGD